jgi:hypothetical protein
LACLRYLCLSKAQGQGSRLASGDLAFDNAEHLFLKSHHALCETGAFALDERAVKGRVHVAMNRPANLLNLGVRQIAKAVHGVEAQPTLARDLDLLHQCHIHVDAGSGQAEAGTRGDRDLRVRR